MFVTGIATAGETQPATVGPVATVPLTTKRDLFSAYVLKKIGSAL